MKCFNCKEEISEKFKHALSQNVCPFCGRGIFSAIDFHFRKSIVGILNKNGIVSETVVLGIINDIEDLVRAPEPQQVESSPQSDVSAPVDPNASIKVSPTDLGGQFTLEDASEPKPTTEEEAEVKQMIQNGELVFSGVVDTSGARKLPIRIGGKPIPRPITRAS
jgi:hypothetical protein